MSGWKKYLGASFKVGKLKVPYAAVLVLFLGGYYLYSRNKAASTTAAAVTPAATDTPGYGGYGGDPYTGGGAGSVTPATTPSTPTGPQWTPHGSYTVPPGTVTPTTTTTTPPPGPEPAPAPAPAPSPAPPSGPTPGGGSAPPGGGNSTSPVIYGAIATAFTQATGLSPSAGVVLPPPTPVTLTPSQQSFASTITAGADTALQAATAPSKPRSAPAETTSRTSSGSSSGAGAVKAGTAKTNTQAAKNTRAG